jgi:hypothetical protein
MFNFMLTCAEGSWFWTFGLVFAIHVANMRHSAFF